MPKVLSKSNKFDLVTYSGEVSGLEGSVKEEEKDEKKTTTRIFTATHLDTQKLQGRHVCAELFLKDVKMRRRARLVLFDLETAQCTEFWGLSMSLRYLIPREAGYLLLGVITTTSSTTSDCSSSSKWSIEIASSSPMICTRMQVTQDLFSERHSYLANRDNICFRSKIDTTSYKHLGFRVAVSDPTRSLDVSVIQCSRPNSSENAGDELKLASEKVLRTFRGKGDIFVPSTSCLVKNLKEHDYIVMQARVSTMHSSSLLPPFYRVSPAFSSLNSSSSDVKKKKKKSETDKELSTSDNQSISWQVQMFALESEMKTENDQTQDENEKSTKKKKKKSKKSKSDGATVFVHDTTICDVYHAISETWPGRWDDVKRRNEALKETTKRLETFRQDKALDFALRPKVETLPPLRKRLVPSWSVLLSTDQVKCVLRENVTKSVQSQYDDDERRKHALKIERSKISQSIEAWNSDSPKDEEGYASL